MWRVTSCGVPLVCCWSSDNITWGPAAHSYQSLRFERVRGIATPPAPPTIPLYKTIMSYVSISFCLSLKPGSGLLGSATCLEIGTVLKCICLWHLTGIWMLRLSVRPNRTYSWRWTSNLQKTVRAPVYPYTDNTTQTFSYIKGKCDSNIYGVHNSTSCIELNFHMWVKSNVPQRVQI